MVTLDDRPGKGHFYSDDGKKWYPSVTGILKLYPKGEKFYQWVAKHGYNAEKIKEAAGNVGTRVHKAIEEIVAKDASPDNVYKKFDLGPAEYIALVGFSNWYHATKPKILRQEFPVISHILRVGGTVDMVAEIDGDEVVIDFKTSRYIAPYFWLQLDAYAFCLAEMELHWPRRLMVLHLNGIYQNSYVEVRQPFQTVGLRQFAALRYLYDFMPVNDRTRDHNIAWTDTEYPWQNALSEQVILHP